MGTSPRAERERVLEAFGRHRMHAHSPAAMIAVGDLVRVPGSDTSFVQEGEVGTAIAVSDEQDLAASSRCVVTVRLRLGHLRPVVAVALAHLRGQRHNCLFPGRLGHVQARVV